MADKYSCFAELAAHERLGVDYRIEIERRNSTAAIIAPHGGKIEPMTTELARLIAGDNHDFYSFVGMKSADNHDLHVTSHHFDEPECLSLVCRCRVVVAIHGRQDRQDPRSIWLGGLDRALITRVSAGLANSGFVAPTGGHEFAARHVMNICNRGQRRMGLQMELPRSLRDRMRSDAQHRDSFVNSVRRSITAHAGLPD